MEARIVFSNSFLTTKCRKQRRDHHPPASIIDATLALIIILDGGRNEVCVPTPVLVIIYPQPKTRGVAYPVLQRGAGQAPPVKRREREDSLGCGSGPVLDEVGLVQHDALPRDLGAVCQRTQDRGAEARGVEPHQHKQRTPNAHGICQRQQICPITQLCRRARYPSTRVGNPNP